MNLFNVTIDETAIGQMCETAGLVFEPLKRQWADPKDPKRVLSLDVLRAMAFEVPRDISDAVRCRMTPASKVAQVRVEYLADGIRVEFVVR